MKYGIGLDIGIASVGFATVLLNEQDMPYRILDIGSRIFEAAENPKDGSSLALPRRTARGMRRRLRRKAHRKERLRELLVNSGLLSAKQLETLYCGKLSDIYELRTFALDKKITEAELARIILHLAQRRGFKSNRKSDASDKEAGKLLAAVSNNKVVMQKNNYRTVGEMFFKDAAFTQHKRNKSESYMATVSRDMIKDELHEIFTRQRGFGAIFASEELEEKVCEILMSQRSFETGPGGNSPYGGNQILKMWGECTLEPEQPRAAKACYSFEYFNLLTKVNNLRILNCGKTEKLNDFQRDLVLKLAHSSPDISYHKLRKELNLPEGALFNGVMYTDDIKENEACEKKKKFAYLKAYHEIRKALDNIKKGHIAALSREQLNEIGMAFTLYKTDDKISAQLLKANLSDIEINELLNLKGFTKSGNLSVKVCDKLIPFLEKGMNYYEACTAAGYNFKGDKSGTSTKFVNLAAAQEYLADTITSPVVKRAMSQCFKVINALIRKYDESPVYINIENARELSKPLEERRKQEKAMNENASENERIMKKIREEYGHLSANGQDLVKFKLYEEQGGICVYSQTQLDITRLFEPGYVDIDHIVPYSISFDDSYKNKVLVLASENRQKGNRLPLEYFKGEKRDKFIVWASTNVRNNKKKQNLLKEKITEDDLNLFKQRNLTDTQTISVFTANYLADNLSFANFETKRKKHVLCIKGAMTSHLRKRWGFSKIRADGDTHHALDAVVIACATDGMVQSVSRYSLQRETQYMPTDDASYAINSKTGEIKSKFPYPWPSFRKEVEARFSQNPSELLRQLHIDTYSEYELKALKPIFVSRMPNRKNTGAAHLETIRSTKAVKDAEVVSKLPLTSLRLNENNEIENYFRPQDDKLLYNALVERLLKHGGDGKKAFADLVKEPFYKPKADGTNGSVVKKVKLVQKSSLNVPVHNGTAVAANGSMVRVDIFYVQNEGYYIVPIYVSDTIKNILPNKAIVALKPYNEWKEMSDDNFIFSLYSNDLIYVETKKPSVFTTVNKASTLEKNISASKFYAYYNSTGISVGSFTVFNHDKAYTIASMGVKTLLKLEKCTVDMLGNVSKCGKEKRMGFARE